MPRKRTRKVIEKNGSEVGSNQSATGLISKSIIHIISRITLSVASYSSRFTSALFGKSVEKSTAFFLCTFVEVLRECN